MVVVEVGVPDRLQVSFPGGPTHNTYPPPPPPPRCPGGAGACIIMGAMTTGCNTIAGPRFMGKLSPLDSACTRRKWCKSRVKEV